ncbi:MAG: GNAT family N-acetyltransferase [Chloroflexi bacterium]|nr:MAG: GNAT family N-acetyltransferase [Chloroflexota bacterium]
MTNIRIDPASESDLPLILSLIKEFADYVRQSHEVAATEDILRKALFGPKRYAEVIIARLDDRPVGFAIFFHNFSTFLGKPGLYLEDLFILPEFRSQGVGKVLLKYLANLAVERGCGRFEWSVLDWNESAMGFYKRLGAVPLEDMTVFRLTGESLKRLANEQG